MRSKIRKDVEEKKVMARDWRSGENPWNETSRWLRPCLGTDSRQGVYTNPDAFLAKPRNGYPNGLCGPRQKNLAD